AGAPGGCRAGKLRLVSVDPNRAALKRPLAEERPREFELPRSHKPVDAEHLACTDRQRYVAKLTITCQAFGCHHDGRIRAAVEPDLANVALFQFLVTGTDHPLDDPCLINSGNRRGFYPPSVAKDRDGIGDTHDIVEKMRDEDEAVTFVAHSPQQA